MVFLSTQNVIFQLILLIVIIYVSNSEIAYYGKSLGRLSELDHGVSGQVYAADARTLHLVNFIYDGQGPGGYFYVGNTDKPSSRGYAINDENGSSAVLRRYRKENITLTLPNGKTLRDIRWFSVWCKDFSVNFGHVLIPKDLQYPRPVILNELKGVHGISSDPVVVVDAQTLLLSNFSYDGEAPDAKFWVGPGSKPRPYPLGIRLRDENGSEEPLKKYTKKTIVLTLPHNLTVFDIGHFGVWCEKFTVDFGHINLPDKSKLNVAPSLKMLNISPQSKLNCEVLYEPYDFQVRWSIAGDYIVIQLLAKLEDNYYMAFGLSGDTKKNQMIGGDVAIAWFDKTNQIGHVQDYFLHSKSQCSGPTGSCPDKHFHGSSNNLELRSAVSSKDYTIITYQRPLKASDGLDKDIYLNQSQAIIWAIGPLNERNEVSYHPIYLQKDVFMDFGRPAKWNCPIFSSNVENSKVAAAAAPVAPSNNKRSKPQQYNTQIVEKKEPVPKRVTPKPHSNRNKFETPIVRNPNAWLIPPIECNEPEDGVFYAQIGPTGGKNGYSAITGHVGWGISWYINGLLIPEIHVVRGKTYTFVIEGGLDVDTPAKYHPFYITDSPIGGYYYKNELERSQERIFAGVERTENNELLATGVGRYCRWEQESKYEPDQFASFGAFQRSLNLKCDSGDPGFITWTPDENTPDTVYYQCYTHRYLGWKIIVSDACDLKKPENEHYPLAADLTSKDYYEASSSIIHENRVQFLGNSDQQNRNRFFRHSTDLTEQQLPLISAKLQSKNGVEETGAEMARILFNQQQKQQQQQQQQYYDEYKKQRIPIVKNMQNNEKRKKFSHSLPLTVPLGVSANAPIPLHRNVQKNAISINSNRNRNTKSKYVKTNTKSYDRPRMQTKFINRAKFYQMQSQSSPFFIHHHHQQQQQQQQQPHRVLRSHRNVPKHYPKKQQKRAHISFTHNPFNTTDWSQSL